MYGCSDTTQTPFQVDLSYERDEGRFNPELGDVISITGSFNDWEPNQDILVDEEGDWIYTIYLYNLPDTVEFKFVISSSSNLDLPNRGWELIENRKMNISTLKKDTPILRFNEPWSPFEVIDVTFSVLMSNQQILGFFDPEKDKVVVSGSFLGWESNGITLQDGNQDGVFEQTMPIEMNPNKPHIYKFRINK